MAMEMKEVQLRSIILYEFKLGHNATIAVKNICNAMGRDAIKLRKCQMCFKRFRSGNFDIEDLPRSGRPKVIESDEIRVAVEADSKITVRELAQKLNIPPTSVYRHLKELGKVSTCGVWVPHKSSEVNIAQRLST
jgi:[histone H3]-lysine36 N-dimethyltransferase SETMAR